MYIKNVHDILIYIYDEMITTIKVLNMSLHMGF